MVDNRRKSTRQPSELPDPKLVREMLRYCESTGEIYWKRRPKRMFGREQDWKTWNTRFSGKAALTAKCNAGKPYLHGYVLSVKLRKHRVVWAICHGSWPVGEIDHIDGDGMNNRIENLRDVDRINQNKNLAMPRTNTSGVVGVHWSKAKSKWVAQISENNRTKCLGRYSCFAKAVKSRRAAERDMGFHPNHGRVQ